MNTKNTNNKKLYLMNAEKVDMYIMTHAKYFQGHHINYIRERLLQLDENKWPVIYSVDLKDPSTMLLVSIFGGSLGIDRFVIGDIGLGIGKLLTCGGFYIWTIIDWFAISDATRQKNMEKLQMVL